MIKKSFLAFLAALFLFGNAALVHAQKLYLFSEGLYDDESIGKSVEIDVSGIRGLFIRHIPEDRLVIYNDPDYHGWTGPRIRNSKDVKNDILRAIRNCPAGSSDTIVFYWHGHGAFDEGGHYLNMPADNDTWAMYRSDIRDALVAQNVHLAVLMTEACHNYSYFEGGSSLSFYKLPPSKVSPLFQSLFFNCSGLVDFNASSPGESSWNCSSGGIFTLELIAYFEENANVYPSWKNVLDGIQAHLQNNKIYNPEHRKFHYYAWSFGGSFDSGGSGNKYICPENGDQITHVNDIEIKNEAHFRQIIRDADTNIVFKLIDHKTGEVYYLSTNLLPKGSSSRLGIYIEDDYRGGVMVTGVMSGMPGARCLHLNSGSGGGNGGGGNSGGSQDTQWSEPVYFPENGDRIIYVDNIEIRDVDHFSSVIRNSDTRIVLTLVDHQKGEHYVLMTDLLPKGSASRLGIYVRDDSRGGVRVVGTMTGLPGEKCRSMKNAKVPPVHSNHNYDYDDDDDDYYYDDDDDDDDYYFFW